jgi:hypothetical protein
MQDQQGGSEFRVRWRRVGQRPRAVVYQRRVAAERKVQQLLGRIDPFAERDADDYACCSGYECGCHGVTVADAREEWLRRYDGVPPFETGPTIESRAVGEWADA